MLQANVMQSSTETYDDQQATQPESCKISIQCVWHSFQPESHKSPFLMSSSAVASAATKMFLSHIKYAT